MRNTTLVLIVLIVLACAVIAYLVIAPLRQPRIVAAQSTAVLIRIGGNASRPLALNEVGWLLSEPGVPDVTRACDGCELVPLDCATVCTYRVIARRLDWTARVGDQELRQGARLYFPLGGAQ